MGSTFEDGPSKEVLCQIVTPVGMLGYGFEDGELYRGLELARQNHPGVPTAIILDSGSTDSGPSKLALGTTTCPTRSYIRDLRDCLVAAREYGVPVLLSSAGGDGEDAHVRTFTKIVADLAAEQEGVRFKVLSIYSNLDRSLVLDRLAAGRITGCGPCVPALTAEAVEATPTIVGQMGPEPFVQAMAAHPDFDVVLGGRAYDPSPYVAFAAYTAFQKAGSAGRADVLDLDPRVLGGFTHMGKIMECGGLCATPKSRGSMAVVYGDGSFDIRPLAVGAVCQPLTVAAHTLYEKSRPDLLAGPGGDLDLTTAVYEQLPDGLSVHVRGATFRPTWNADRDGYTVKLEGARQTGYRTIFMGSFCDPILLSQLPAYLEQAKVYVAAQNKDLDRGSWQLDFHVYDGRDHEGEDGGLLQPQQPPVDFDPSAAAGSPPPPGVVFIVGEALAATQEQATGIASAARIACVHGPYKGQKANSGNFGMGIGGRGEIEMGACAEFSVYHVVDLVRGEEGAAEVVGGGGGKAASAGHVPGAPLFRYEASWAGADDGKRITELPFRFSEERAQLVHTVANGSSKKGTNGVSSTNGTNGTATKSVNSNGTAATKTAKTTTTTTTLGALAKILRSKNSGPYEITMDVLFDDAAVYDKVKASGAVTAERVAALYGIALDQVVYCGFFDQALAFKVTLPRMRHGRAAASGGYMENDVHGSQKYKPLMNLEVEW